MTYRTFFAHTTLAAAVMGACMATVSPQVARAQGVPAETAMRFEAPSGDLGVALTSLAQQAGHTLSTPAELVRGLKSSPVSGTMTLREALRTALAGTGLDLRSRPDGTLTVVKSQAAVVSGAQAVLPTVNVETNASQAAAGGGATSGAAGSLGFAPLASSGVTRTDTSVPNVPRTITVVPNAVLESQHVQDLTTALQNVAGLIATPSTSGTPTYGVRGFNAVDQVTVNGMRDPQFTNRSMANVEQIEVVKGPAAVINGNQPAGGFINVVLKKPTAEPLRVIGVNGGTGNFASVTADLGGAATADKQLTYRLNLESATSEHNFGGYDGKKRWLFAPVFALKTGALDALVGYEQYHDFSPRNPYSAAPGVVGEFPAPFKITPTVIDNPASGNTSNSKRPYYEAQYSLVDGDSASLKFRSRAQYTERKDLSANYFPIATDPQTLEISQFQGSAGITRFEDTSVQNDLVGKFATGPVSHTVLVGADYRKRTRLVDSYSLPNLGSCGFCTGVRYFLASGNPLTPTTGPLLLESTSVITERGLIVQDQLDIGKDTHVLASMRHGTYLTDAVTNRYNTVTGALARTITSPHRETTANVYNVGVSHQVTESIVPYASYSTGYNPNDLLDRTGALLPAETQKQFELGVKFALREDKLSALVNVFTVDKNNTPLLDVVVQGVPSYVAAPGQTSKGLEMSLQGELAPGWNLTSTYAYVKATVKNKSGAGPDGAIAFNTPKHNLSAWSTYYFQQPEFKDIGVGFGVYLRGKTYGTSVGIPGYGIANAALYFNGIKNVRLALTMNNVFDKYYFQPTTANFFVPIGEPRSALLSASLSF